MRWILLNSFTSAYDASQKLRNALNALTAYLVVQRSSDTLPVQFHVLSPHIDPFFNVCPSPLFRSLMNFVENCPPREAEQCPRLVLLQLFLCRPELLVLETVSDLNPRDSPVYAHLLMPSIKMEDVQKSDHITILVTVNPEANFREVQLQFIIREVLLPCSVPCDLNI